ncbi:MAG: phosphate signaling complex protein PhoU [Oscillospiraceae bacterium]|nr:phosphate signaling complex protein PhoU [Oscillospiraceae bacterium]
MRLKFDEQLDRLNNLLIEMGWLVEQAIADANKALVEKDVDLAKKVIELDDEVDSREKELDSLCLRLIMQQQPVASDLRFISAILKIITNLERIGDHASDISEITISLAGKQYIKKLEHIPQMADAAIKMVTESIGAFVKKDLDLAREVIASDKFVDNLFETVKNDLILLIKEKADNGDQAIDLMMVAKYFEKIADHATNVAEWVVFSITGTHKDIKIM